jgi:hypothetical protein
MTFWGALPNKGRTGIRIQSARIVGLWHCSECCVHLECRPLRMSVLHCLQAQGPHLTMPLEGGASSEQLLPCFLLQTLCCFRSSCLCCDTLGHVLHNVTRQCTCRTQRNPVSRPLYPTLFNAPWSVANSSLNAHSQKPIRNHRTSRANRDTRNLGNSMISCPRMTSSMVLPNGTCFTLSHSGADAGTPSRSKHTWQAAAPAVT